jgi:hypothetical protein
LCLIFSAFALLALHGGNAVAAEPLHERIDKLVAAVAGGELSPRTDDASFLRRVHLDFVGRIPTADEAREFLDSDAADKRVALIDRLLASDQFAENMARRFHIMLMERRGDEPEWMTFLTESFRVNKPWDLLTKEIISPSDADPKTRGAAYFYTKRLEKYGQNPVDYPGLVRDVGRMFLGVDVQCAQCHDHLFIGDYEQIDYQGLFAYVGKTAIRRGTEFPAIVEQPLLKKIDFQSVFDEEAQATGPRLPGGREIDIPELKKSEAYSKPPDSKTKFPGELKFSPLRVLGEELPSADNRLFVANAVNRLWWTMMGRGIVDPLDVHHSENPPSHPQLLDELAAEFVAHKFDIKWFLRELALSETYQRSSLLRKSEATAGPAAEPAADRFQVALERPLSAEQLLDSVLTAIRMRSQLPEQPAATEDDPPGDEAGPPADGLVAYESALERFRTALANPPREPEIAVNSTVKSALFLMHDEILLAWLQPRDGNLINHLAKSESAAAGAEELYLSVLSRRPTAAEVAEVTAHLESMPDRQNAAWSQLAWALLASTEFFVNH